MRARHARRAARSAAADDARRGRRRGQVRRRRRASIPDYLALVGDSADGFPGLAGWGAKSAAAVLATYGHLEAIPDDYRAWTVDVARAGALAATLKRDRALALRFKELATLRTDVPVFDTVDELAYRGPRPEYRALRQRLDAAVATERPGPTAR